MILCWQLSLPEHENLFYNLFFAGVNIIASAFLCSCEQTKTCICHLCFKRLYTDHSCRMDFVVIIWIDRDLAYRSCHRSDCMPVFIPVSFSRHTHSNSTVNIKTPTLSGVSKVSGYKIHLLYPDTFPFLLTFRCTQYFICIFNPLFCRRINPLQRILISEFFPFICSERMIRKDFDFFHIT